MKLVIFDCDGVLIDSEIIADRVLLQYLQALHPQIDFAALNGRMHGMMTEDILALAEAEYQVRFPSDACAIIMQRLDTALHAEIEPVNGIEKALQTIVLPKAVASNSTASHVALMLEKVGLAHFFGDQITGADQVSRPKPYPDVYLQAAHRAQTAAEYCLVVEDSATGTQAAKAAGMTVIGFVGASHADWGQRSRLIDAGASEIIDSMQQLPQTLQAYCES